MDSTNCIFSDHARMEMSRRDIGEHDVLGVLQNPDQYFPIREGRMVYQSKIKRSDLSKEYILRVFVDMDRNPQEIVTAYVSSKVNKYWRTSNESNL